VLGLPDGHYSCLKCWELLCADTVPHHKRFESSEPHFVSLLARQSLYLLMVSIFLLLCNNYNDNYMA
jgi:hypothetical protein